MSSETRNPYEPLRQIADGLYCVDGWWSRSPMGRRMTVMRIGDDRLALHALLRMRESDMGRLEKLGQVAYLIAPNLFHASEAPWYAERYPQARVLVSRGMRQKQEPRMRVDGDVDRWPEELTGELEALPLEGLRIGESALLHVRSNTLVLTDLVMNFDAAHFKGMAKLVMRLNGIVDRFGPSRVLRYGAIKDKAKLRRSLERVLEWDFDRIVMNHGRVLETGGRERIREAFEFLSLG